MIYMIGSWERENGEGGGQGDFETHKTKTKVFKGCKLGRKRKSE